MKTMNIEQELPELHRLGVTCGITCGVSNKEDLRRLAKICSQELNEIAKAREEVGKELSEAMQLLECKK